MNIRGGFREENIDYMPYLPPNRTVMVLGTQLFSTFVSHQQLVDYKRTKSDFSLLRRGSRYNLLEATINKMEFNDHFVEIDL